MIMLTRKKKLLLTLLSILSLSFLIVGCSAKQEADAGVKSGESQSIDGGEFTYGLATAPDTLDPHLSTMAVSARVIKNTFETLVEIDENDEIIPSLAEEWELSDDKKTYTFKLRKDVTFHDDTPFNAEAVKYNFERILDPESGAATTAIYLKLVESVKILDDYTVEVILEEPSATFLKYLGHFNLSIVSPKAVEEYGTQLGQHPVGTGPFKFESLTENDQIVLTKYENYHGHFPFVEHEGPANLDKLIFKIIPEESTRIGSVQSGQITAAETIPPQDIVSIQDSDQLKLWEAEAAGLSYTLFINNTTEPWDSVEARQALAESIDVDSIVNTLYLGTYERSWSALTPNTFGYDDSLENKDLYNVKKANETFDKIGWIKDSDGLRKKNGKTLTLRILDDAVNREKRQDISLMVQEQLKEVGIDVQIETTTEGITIMENSGAYDLRGNSRVALDPEDLSLFYYSTAEIGTGGFNIPWYKNKEVDQWLDDARVEFDQEKREQLYKNIQQKLIEEAVIIPVYVFPYTVASAINVEGITFDSVGYPLFYNVKLSN